MNDFETTVDTANRLPHVLHWAVGVLVCLIGMVVENPGGFLHFNLLAIAGAIALGGLVLSIPSRLLMGLCPWPYAWLARRLGYQNQKH